MDKRQLEIEAINKKYDDKIKAVKEEGKKRLELLNAKIKQAAAAERAKRRKAELRVKIILGTFLDEVSATLKSERDKKLLAALSASLKDGLPPARELKTGRLKIPAARPEKKKRGS